MNTKLTQSQEKQFKVLLMQAMDNELTPDEKREFERFLETFDECKHGWQQFEKLKAVTRDMKFKSPPEEVWDKFWANVRHRLERGSAWILFSIGSISL
ncbi:MAG: hypothetical protein ACE5IR_17555 [bacterium]